MDTLIRDLRVALRNLRRRPGFTLAATATLALGIGANTVMFSLFEAVLLEAPPYLTAPDRIVALYTSDFSGPLFGSSSYADYLDVRAESATFSGVATFEPTSIAFGEGATIEQRAAGSVSGDWFGVLGVTPAVGRFFAAGEDDAPGDVVVLSHRLWQLRLGASASAVGSTVRINGASFTVVGIAPDGFVGFDRTMPVDVWIPVRTALRAGLDVTALDARSSRGIAVVARLADGVTTGQAQARMDVFAQRMHTAYPEAWTDVRGEVRRLTVVPERLTRVPPESRATVLGLFGVLGATVGIVLLICCANIAGLLLARAAGRAHEVGVRVAVGAARGRVVRQLLTESLVLAALGALAGVAIAFWTMDLLVATGLEGGPVGMVLDPRVDGSVLLFTTGVTLVTGILFGLAPALRATRLGVAQTLRSAAPGLHGGRASLRGALVAGQLALSLLLLIAALLLARSLRAAWAIDPGFATDGTLLVSIAPLPGSADADVAGTALAVRDRLTALPGVSAVTWASASPFTGFGSRRGMRMEGYEPAPGEDMEVHINMVGPAFFQTLGIPLAAGRPIAETDREGAQRVAVVNEAFVRRFWDGVAPLGRTLSMSRGEYVVVGIARDVRFLSLREPARPYVWVSALQELRAPQWFIRTRDGVAPQVASIAGAVREVAPGWAVSTARTLDDQLSSALFEQRVAGGALGLFAILALALAGIGLWGIVAYAISQRTREIGIRIALGARPDAVVTLFVREALPLVVIGGVTGVVAAWATTRLMSGLLIGIAATDPLTFIGGPAFLTLVALLACWLPARRASRVDPLIALRSE